MVQNPEATIVFGVLNETFGTESRVALMPDIVIRLERSGASLLIETDAGIVVNCTDEDYERTGARVTNRDEVFTEAGAFGSMDRPFAETVVRPKADQQVIGMLGSSTDTDYVVVLEKAGLVDIAIEKLPRKPSSTQSMDEMISQNLVMGYKAAITAADACGSFLSMITTAAGTIYPVKALVFDTGIAGLQAIGTLRRLGVIVTMYDVHPASQGEAESLGAKFLDSGLSFSKGQGKGGYAHASSVKERIQQQAAVDEGAAGFDITIITAKVPGRKSPVLFTAADAKGLKCGAVIVDCAVSDLGGNVGSSVVDKQVTEDDVKLIGAPCLAPGVATIASGLLSRNVTGVLVHPARDGKLGQDFTGGLDDTLVTAGHVAAPTAIADAERSEKQGRRNIVPTLVVFITLFVLVLLIGIEVIGRVPATLHTPFIPGVNSIHGTVVVDAVIAAARADNLLAYVLIFLVAMLDTMNIVGGYVVTDCMFEVFKSSKNEKKGGSK